MRANDFLFEVRFKLYRDGGHVTVRAFDRYETGHHGHSFIRCELVFDGKKIFSDGRVGIPSHQCIDGECAKENAVALFCIKPGDTDREFFDGYSEEQLAFVEKHGEALDLERFHRWGDR